MIEDVEIRRCCCSGWKRKSSDQKNKRKERKNKRHDVSWVDQSPIQFVPLRKSVWTMQLLEIWNDASSPVGTGSGRPSWGRQTSSISRHTHTPAETHFTLLILDRNSFFRHQSIKGRLNFLCYCPAAHETSSCVSSGHHASRVATQTSFRLRLPHWFPVIQYIWHASSEQRNSYSEPSKSLNTTRRSDHTYQPGRMWLTRLNRCGWGDLEGKNILTLQLPECVNFSYKPRECSDKKKNHKKNQFNRFLVPLKRPWHLLIHSWQHVLMGFFISAANQSCNSKLITFKASCVCLMLILSFPMSSHYFWLAVPTLLSAKSSAVIQKL